MRHISPDTILICEGMKDESCTCKVKGRCILYANYVKIIENKMELGEFTQIECGFESAEMKSYCDNFSPTVTQFY
jgi:hypothetical protein